MTFRVRKIGYCVPTGPWDKIKPTLTLPYGHYDPLLGVKYTAFVWCCLRQILPGTSGWPRTHNPPASFSQVLGFYVYVTVPGVMVCACSPAPGMWRLDGPQDFLASQPSLTVGKPSSSVRPYLKTWWRLLRDDTRGLSLAYSARALGLQASQGCMMRSCPQMKQNKTSLSRWMEKM